MVVITGDPEPNYLVRPIMPSEDGVLVVGFDQGCGSDGSEAHEEALQALVMRTM